MSAQTGSDELAFRHCYQMTNSRVYAYVRRHCTESECDDIIAEVYLAAWRRFAELPPDPLPWLLGTARKVLGNHWRSRGRRQRLATEIAGLNQATTPDSSGTAVERTDLLRALERLAAADREVLLLTGWDGLDTAGLATALDCSAVAARARLSRARRRLAAELTEADLTPHALQSVTERN